MTSQERGRELLSKEEREMVMEFRALDEKKKTRLLLGMALSILEEQGTPSQGMLSESGLRSEGRTGKQICR